jgi:hypothetical protein
MIGVFDGASSESLFRAHSGSSIFPLGALVTQEMLRQHKIRCRCATVKPANHAGRSKDQQSNSQATDEAAFSGTYQKVCFVHFGG